MSFARYFTKALLDEDLKKDLGGHYAVDTNVIFGLVPGMEDEPENLGGFRSPGRQLYGWKEMQRWFSESKITVYSEILKELMPVHKIYSEFLDQPNVRIVTGNRNNLASKEDIYFSIIPQDNVEILTKSVVSMMSEK